MLSDTLIFFLFCAIMFCLYLGYTMIQDCWKYIKIQDEQIKTLQQQIGIIREELSKN